MDCRLPSGQAGFGGRWVVRAHDAWTLLRALRRGDFAWATNCSRPRRWVAPIRLAIAARRAGARADGERRSCRGRGRRRACRASRRGHRGRLRAGQQRRRRLRGGAAAARAGLQGAARSARPSASDSRATRPRWRGAGASAIEPLAAADLAGADLIVDALFGAGLDAAARGRGGRRGGGHQCVGQAGRRRRRAERSRRHDGRGERAGRAGDAHRHVLPAEARRICCCRAARCAARCGSPTSAFPTPCWDEIGPRTFANRPSLWRAPIPWPRLDGHKYSARPRRRGLGPGRAARGPPASARAGALRIGAGLVTVVGPATATAVNATQLTAIMVKAVGADAALAEFLADERHNAVLIGPGAGVGAATAATVLTVLASPAAAVLDADALTSFAPGEDGEPVRAAGFGFVVRGAEPGPTPDGLFAAIKGRPAPVVLTPHEGEFKRLFGELPGSKLDRARQAAELSGAVVDPEGRRHRDRRARRPRRHQRQRTAVARHGRRRRRAGGLRDGPAGAAHAGLRGRLRRRVAARGLRGSVRPGPDRGGPARDAAASAAVVPDSACRRDGPASAPGRGRSASRCAAGFATARARTSRGRRRRPAAGRGRTALRHQLAAHVQARVGSEVGKQLAVVVLHSPAAFMGRLPSALRRHWCLRNMQMSCNTGATGGALLRHSAVSLLGAASLAPQAPASSPICAMHGNRLGCCDGPRSVGRTGETRPLPETTAQREAAPTRAGTATPRPSASAAWTIELPAARRRHAIRRSRRPILTVGAHEFVAIVGPTGCGKSTLLNVAAGLLAPSAGETFVLGERLAGLNRHAGYLFQQDAVMPWKTARDNVAIGLEVAGIRPPRGAGARAGLAQARRARRLRRPLSPPALGRAEEARRPRPGADPRSPDPAHGRAVRPARRPDAADHGQPAARTVGRRAARPCCSSPTTSRRRSRSPTAS